MSEVTVGNIDGLEDEESSTMKIEDFSSGVDVQFPVCCQWWKRHSGAVAVCLGLLCVLLVAGLIGLSVHYRSQSSMYNNLTEERDLLQTSYYNVSEEIYQLQISYNNLPKKRGQLQTSYNNLSKERDQIQTSYNNLSKERDQLREELNQAISGWRLFGSSWYFLSAEKKSWESSRQDCLKRGANLVTINSQEEQIFLHGLGRSSELYIGLHDIITEGSWEWIGVGTSGQSSSVTTYWKDGEPSNGDGEDCAVIMTSTSDPLKSWKDVKCTWEIKWVCERTASTL